MFSLKHIAAYFLLLVYSVSFGHQIIPHHHHENSENHSHHLEGAHDHCVTEEETHNHVAHEDHFDEGLIDYLGCVLGSHEHNSATEYEFIEGDQKNRENTTNSDQFIAVLTTNSNLNIERLNLQFQGDYQPSSNNDPLSENRAKRGPPQA